MKAIRDNNNKWSKQFDKRPHGRGRHFAKFHADSITKTFTNIWPFLLFFMMTNGPNSMIYCANNICPDEQTEERTWRTDSPKIMHLPTWLGDEGITKTSEIASLGWVPTNKSEVPINWQEKPKQAVA